MTDQEIKRIFEVYKPPFHYSDDFQAIVDTKDDIVTTHIRGWAFLQKLPDGIQIQDNIGKLIAELLNREYERLKAG